ncbi:MAG: GspE/PulE family protein [Dehalococcoidia bacterium]
MVQPLRKPDDSYGSDSSTDEPNEPELVLLTQPPVEEFDWATLGSGEAATKLLPEDLARKYLSFPARVTEGKLLLVMADPQDYRAIQTLELRSSMEVTPVKGAPADVLNAIDIHYSATMNETISSAIDDEFAAPYDARNGIRQIALVVGTANAENADDSPVIQAIDSLISQAAKARATDIHIEPMESRVRVRFRVDGFLQEVGYLPLAAHNAIISRLKIMSGMDIAERKRPQDGHFAVKIEKSELEVRAATTDTVHGEMAVLRILNKSLKLFSLGDLGLSEHSSQSLKDLIKAPYGIILVSGPTGAGKTTTLYAGLNEIDSRRLNIITIEDPVEYRFPGINSIQINDKAGVTFPTSLRAVLRLDPDVVLVGEIRDSETARIAVQAALTGHLVMSSVHANDAVRAVSRLVDLGVEPFLLSSALLGVVSQRMVRKVCEHCVTVKVPEGEEAGAAEQLGFNPANAIPMGTGCYFCGFTGYRGRTGLYEVLSASEEFRQLVMQRASNKELMTEARRSGFRTLKEDGIEKVSAGITTPFEILRSVYAL